MAQSQGPPPEILSVTSSGLSLRVVWENDPYTSPSGATLIYINNVSNTMYSVLLNQEQILNEEYYITDNLIIGDLFSVFFSTVQTGITHNSNTVSVVYSTVPAPPTLVSIDLGAADYSTAVATATINSNGGSAVTYMVFRVLLEGGAVSTQSFQYSNTNLYTLTGLVVDQDYIVSVQAVNANGYGNVSNSIAFRNNRSPDTPTLGTIQSGNNGFVDLPITGVNRTDQDSEITGFNVYYKLNSASSYLGPVRVRFDISAAGGYSITLNNFAGSQANPLVNGTEGYNFKVAAVNDYGEGLASNISNAVPALNLQYSDINVTFPTSNSVTVTWDVNNASWETTGSTTLTLSGTGVSASQTVSNLSPRSATFEGLTLTAAATYTVSFSGFTEVPVGVYGVTWIAPTLTYRQFLATSNSGSAVYATVPGSVSDIGYTTNINQNNPTTGQITFNWTAAPANGSTILDYTCTLYTVANNTRTIYLPASYTNPITIDALAVTFQNLPVSNLYAVGIVARNAIGSGPETYFPASSSEGITILAAVNPVTNLVGTQTNYDGTTFTGELTWNYSGPGQGYQNAQMLVYQVVNSVYTELATVQYSAGISSYSYNVNLGTTTNTPFTYAIRVSAVVTISGSTTYSSYNQVTIITGLPPLISNVLVVEISQDVWQLSFKVTNPTAGAMISNSIVSIVMPNPITLILPNQGAVNPVNNNYDVGLVPNGPTGYTYTYILDYQAISDDYVTITASNVYGSSIYNNKWGSN